MDNYIHMLFFLRCNSWILFRIVEVKEEDNEKNDKATVVKGKRSHEETDIDESPGKKLKTESILDDIK